MISQKQNHKQNEVCYKYLVFHQMLQDMPNFIENEIKKIEKRRRDDALTTSPDINDTYTETDYCTDDEGGCVAEEEHEIPIAASIAANDPRNAIIDILDEMERYFYHAMHVMLYSFAEYSLKDLQKHSPPKKSKIEYLYEDIAKRFEHIDFGKAIDYWKNVRHYNDVRNQIVHNGEVHKREDEPTKEYLLTNLDSIKNMLMHVAKAVDENSRSNIK